MFCSEHHRIVDANPRIYSVEVLAKYKADHEARMAPRNLRPELPPLETDTVDLSLLPVSELPDTIWSEEGTPAPGNRSDYHDATGQAVAAAARLAEDPGTGPGSAAGTAVLNTLLGTVAVAVGLNRADTESRQAPEAPTARAAEGVLALLCRNDWAASPSGARIGAAARGLLEHDQPAVRAVGVSGLHFIIPLSAARYARTTELIQDEVADFVRARLLVQLASLLPDMPAEVDRSLANLGSMGAWPVLAAAPQDFDAPSAEPGGTAQGD